MSRPTRIFVAITSGNGQVSAAVTTFLCALEKLNTRNKGYEFSWQIVAGVSPRQYARNIAVGTFLTKTKADRLWFIDNDMIPSGSSMAMLEVDADIVGARTWAYGRPMGQSDPTLMPVAFNQTDDGLYESIAATDKVVECDAVGTATMLIRRRVLADRKMHMDPAYVGLDGKKASCERENGVYAPAVFVNPYKPNGEEIETEDTQFCIRAKKLGYSVMAHLGAVFGHMKPVDLEEMAQLLVRVSEAVQIMDRKIETRHASPRSVPHPQVVAP